MFVNNVELENWNIWNYSFPIYHIKSCKKSYSTQISLTLQLINYKLKNTLEFCHYCTEINLKC